MTRTYLKSENDIKVGAADFLKVKYPYLIWDMKWDHINFANIIECNDGNKIWKKNFVQAAQIKRISCEHAIPDFHLFFKNNKYGGLALEFKKDKDEVFTKKGYYRENEHICAQKRTLENMWTQHLYTSFCWSTDMFIDIIDKYVNNNILQANVHSFYDDFIFAGWK